ncbi:MAG: hypothetical protein K0R02_71 [Rickettsiaceae bacterium]|nr:hypothetical protein [Rickettsiaceae bacterium]
MVTHTTNNNNNNTANTLTITSDSIVNDLGDNFKSKLSLSGLTDSIDLSSNVSGLDLNISGYTANAMKGAGVLTITGAPITTDLGDSFKGNILGTSINDIKGTVKASNVTVHNNSIGLSSKVSVLNFGNNNSESEAISVNGNFSTCARGMGTVSIAANATITIDGDINGVNLNFPEGSTTTIKQSIYPASISMFNNAEVIFKGEEISLKKGDKIKYENNSITLNKDLNIKNSDNLELHITPKHVANESEHSLTLSDLVHLNNLSKIASKPNAPEIEEQYKPLLGLNEEQKIELSIDDIDNLPAVFSVLDDVLDYHADFAVVIVGKESGL